MASNHIISSLILFALVYGSLSSPIMDDMMGDMRSGRTKRCFGFGGDPFGGFGDFFGGSCGGCGGCGGGCGSGCGGCGDGGCSSCSNNNCNSHNSAASNQAANSGFFEEVFYKKSCECSNQGSSNCCNSANSANSHNSNSCCNNGGCGGCGSCGCGGCGGGYGGPWGGYGGGFFGGMRRKRSVAVEEPLPASHPLRNRYSQEFRDAERAKRQTSLHDSR